jgi:hypothetical protein
MNNQHCITNITTIRVGKLKLYNDRSTTNARTAHNRRPYVHMLEKTVKEAHFTDVKNSLQSQPL